MPGAPELRRTFSSGSGEASLTELRPAVDKLGLDDGSGRRSDVDAPGLDGPVPVTNASDPFGMHGSSSSLHQGLFPDSLYGQTEKLDEGRGAPSQAIQCENVETGSLASQTSISNNAFMEFDRRGDGLPIRNSVDEGSLPMAVSNISAHGGNVHQNVFVFGEHAGYQDFTVNATQTSTSNVDSADKGGATYNSEQINASVAKDSTCTKFILWDAKHAFGYTNKNPLHSEPCEISPAVKFGSTFGSEDGSAKISVVKVPYDVEAVEASKLTECRSFDEKIFTVQDHNVACKNKGVKGMTANRRTVMPKKFSSDHQVSSLESVSRTNDVSSETKVNLKDALLNSGINCAQGNSCNSALQITESSRDGTEFTSAANTEHSGQSDFIFSASTSKHGTLQLQRRHNKKKGGGMSYHANSTQNLPSSAIGLAHSEVASRQCVDSAAQWTEYTKMEPSRVTISRGAEFTKKENFEHHEDCETWRLRCLHDVLLSLPFSYLASNLVVENLQNYFEISGDRRSLDQNLGGCLDFYR